MSTLTFFAQETPKELYTAHNKGKFFFWGGNRGWYSNSNITFTGNGYDFTIKDVEAVTVLKVGISTISILCE
jgi:hypothetical protein